MTVLDELLVRIGMDASGVDEGTEQVTGKLDSMAGPAGLAGAAAGGALALGLSAAMDISSAQSSLRDQLDLTEAEAARAGGIAGDVYSAGFGESMDEVANAVGGVVSSMGELGDFTDAELQQMSKSALALAKRFDIDVADAAQAAGNMINNGLVKDGTEAFDVLAAAAQMLPKQMLADIPATVNEYGKHWAKIGLDGKTAMAMMSQYVKAGGRDIDQAGDVLHEFARITSEESARAGEALTALGLPASKMLADIHKGGEPARAALQKTIESLRGVKDPAEQAELGIALFGDMAGEGADALWAMDPATAAASTGMDKAAGAAGRLTDKMEDDPAQQMDAAMRTLTTGLGEALLPALLLVSGFFAENKGLMEVLVPVVLGLALAFGVFAITVWAVNAALLANPITWIILGIIALIAIVVVLIMYWDEIAKAAGIGWDLVKMAVGMAMDWISGKISKAMDWISEKWNQAWGWISGKAASAVATVMGYIDTMRQIPVRVGVWVGQMVAWVSGLPGRISRAASGMWDSITRSFKGMVNQLISGWNNLTLTIGGGSIMGVSIPSLTLSTPNIPYLADGGITTGPTLAMIGEGREDEAVLPLSRLEQLINTQQDVRAPSVRKTSGAAAQVRITLDATGGSSALRTALQEIVRAEAGGDVQTAFGQ
ncbi:MULTISPECIES: phage tail tape measure protein [unclassified Streptomyces]|uniref:phage tail tape measure protein n=1 Tax=unclassified Streptomyces TaxID=2593676 RepID=UPI0038232BA7